MPLPTATQKRRFTNWAKLTSNEVLSKPTIIFPEDNVSENISSSRSCSSGSVMFRRRKGTTKSSVTLLAYRSLTFSTLEECGIALTSWVMVRGPFLHKRSHRRDQEIPPFMGKSRARESLNGDNQEVEGQFSTARGVMTLACFST